MSVAGVNRALIVACFMLGTAVRCATGAGWDSVIPVIDWRAVPAAGMELKGAVATVLTNGWVEVLTRKESGRAGIKVHLPADARNLETRSELAVAVRNTGVKDLRIIFRVDDPSTEALSDDQARKWTFRGCIQAGEEAVWLVVPMGEPKTAQSNATSDSQFISMVGQPVDFVRRGVVDSARVSCVSIFTLDPEEEQRFQAGPVIARGAPTPFRGWPAERIFPIVDEFGQYAHRDWPNKIHSIEDLLAQKNAEEAVLAANARPGEWDRYGGWANGPRLKVTGFFYAQKTNGAWWLVDPEGRLFWSHGIVRVGTRIRVGSEYRGTPLPDREHFFKLPERGAPFDNFYGTEPQSTRRYYVGRDDHAVYDFLEANLYRKYGADWRSGYAAQSQRRLASWGLNTIANSSDPAIFLRRQTPYTAIVYSAPLGRSEFRLEGSAGNWGKVPDPFDPGWRRLIDRTLRSELRDSLRDPWCLGFFVDNELHWGETNYLGEATLASPGTQAAKRALMASLKAKYEGTGALNAAWGTAFADWDAFLSSTNLPWKARVAARADLARFGEQYLDAYFRGCREAIKRAAPNHMYLGCRFAGSGNAIVMRVATRYCDVVSINRYADSVSDLRLPEGLDRPILIGEFHFTAMDAPMQPSGLVLVADHNERARAYVTYVGSALRNPAIVGTHWFQYYDQPTTGRFDGENYQTGLLDICDTPYAATVGACRAMGRTLYQARSRAFGESSAK